MKNTIILSVLCLLSSGIFAQTPETKPNFIFILVDDLNDYIGVLGGHPQVETPNIDSLAKHGVTFLNAYCNSPGCAPSRTSMLSGKDPNYTQVFNNEDYNTVFRDNFTVAENNAEVYTLPQMLKDSGDYFTYAIDKVFHSPSENDYDKFGITCSREKSWSRMVNIQPSDYFTDQSHLYTFGDAFDFGMIPDSLEPFMEDFIAVDTAISFIDHFADHTYNTCDRPFFLALGIHRPHSERYIPQKYFPPYYMNDIFSDSFHIIYNSPVGSYPYNGLVMPPQPDPMFNDYYQLPTAGIAQSCANVGDVFDQIENYSNSLPYLPTIDSALTDEERLFIVEETVRANYVASYIAAVQFMDAMVGKVLDALNAHPELAANTVVVFTSDHGYSLGEKRHWTKWSLWETDIRMPLIIQYPGHTENAISSRVVSLMDLYPTVCDMAGVNYPHFTDGSDYLDGNSFVGLLDRPDTISANVAVTTYKKNAGMGSCFPHVSVRNERFHYIRYQYNNNDGTGAGTCDALSENYDEELYDIGTERQNDPYEWNNLADDPAYSEIKNYLQQFLPDGDLYHQQPYVVNIYNNDVECLLNNTGHVQMRCALFTPEAVPVTADHFGEYTFSWTNNLTGEIHTGPDYIFDLSSISTGVFATADQLVINLTVRSNATGKIVAYKMKHFFLHAEDTPEVNFDDEEIDHTLFLNDITFSGSYKYATWDFGDGYTTDDKIPGPHTYAAAGSYVLSTTLHYGNKCDVTYWRNVVIDSGTFRSNNRELQLVVWPNPASSYLQVALAPSESAVMLTVYNIMGQELFHRRLSAGTTQMQLNVADWPAGNYFLHVQSADGTETKIFNVVQ